LINLARNIGGSILIAVTNALVTERSMFHQSQMLKYLTPTDPYFQTRVDALKNSLTLTAGKNNAAGLAQGRIYSEMLRQAQALGYVDVFFLLCGASMIMIPMAFLLKKNHPGGEKTEIAVH
jgi:DHA2 family multidrug resistance protein